MNNVEEFSLYLPEIFSIAEKLYATTAVVYFSINCFIIASMLDAIGKEVKTVCESSLTTTLASAKLNLLQNHHILICHSVELLNDSFGIIFLLGVPFIFIALINTIMKFLVTSGTESDEYDLMLILPRSILIFTLSANLFIICFSAENLKVQVHKLS